MTRHEILAAVVVQAQTLLEGLNHHLRSDLEAFDPAALVRATDRINELSKQVFDATIAETQMDGAIKEKSKIICDLTVVRP